MSETKTKFESLDSDEQNTVLRIGMMMFEHGKRGLTDAAVASERESAEEKMRELREEAFRSKEELRTELENVRTRALDRERELRERFREEVGDRATQLAEGREAVLQRELERVREDALRERERLATEHTAAIERLREATDRLMGAAENSSKRGKAGEIVASEEVRRVFKDATDIVDKASEGRSGDIHVTLPGIGKIILDIKHHAKGSGGVRKKDRDKLLRDIDDEKNDAVGGILVATQASIQGMEPCSVLYSPKHHRPMVACELRGDWDRLRDARSVLSKETSTSHPNNNITVDRRGLDTSNDGVVLQNTLRRLRDYREGLRDKIIEITQLMGDVCVSLERYKTSTWVENIQQDDEVENWILSRVNIVKSTPIKTTPPVSVKVIANDTQAPPELNTKKGQVRIRDLLLKAGAKFIKTTQTTTNVVLRTEENI